jgi:hypothetical protein
MPEEPDELLYHRMQIAQAAELGRAISAWAYFEYRLDETIWLLARLEEEPGACLTAQFGSVAQRFNALFALARVEKITERSLKKMNDVRNRALAIAEKRNRIAHDPWFYGYESQQHYRMHKTAKAVLEFKLKPVSLEELKAIEQEFVDLTHKFNEARSAITKEFLRLPGEPVE